MILEKQKAISNRSQSQQKTALSLEEKAIAGDADAQYQLGIHYEDLSKQQPNGSEKKKKYYNEAQRYLEKAAAQNHIKSLYKLGESFYFNNVHQRISVLKKASDLGDVESLYLLGCIYDTGNDSIVFSKEKGFECFIKAAKLEHLDAQHAVAVAYYYGEGVQRNLNESKKWFERAANQGHQRSKESLKHYFNR